MALWSAWFPDLLPHLPGCPNAVVQHELKRAAQEFFEKTRAWRVLLAPVAVAAGTDELDLVPTDTEQSLVRVEEAWYDNRKIDPLTADEASAEFGDDWMSHTGAPSAYVQEFPGTLRLYPIPDTDALTGLKFRVSVKPSESCTGLPDALADKFRDALADGAKGRLMLYPGKDWTNLDLGAAMKGQFESAKSAGNLQANRSFGRGRNSNKARWC